MLPAVGGCSWVIVVVTGLECSVGVLVSVRAVRAVGFVYGNAS